MSADEGIVLDAAWKMYNGKSVYSDFFLLPGPLPAVLVAFAFLVFEPSYFVAQSVSLVMLLMSVGSVYALSRLLLKQSFAVVAAYVWLLASGLSALLINYNTYSAYFGTVAVACIAHTLLSKRMSIAALGGIACGLQILCVQHMGVAVSAISIVFLFFSSVRLCSSFLLGLFSVLLPALYIWGWAPLVEFISYRDSYLAVTRLSTSYTLYIFFLVAISLVAALLFAIGKRSSTNVYLVFLQLVMFAATFSLPDLGHLSLVSYPLIVLSLEIPAHFWPRLYWWGRSFLLLLGVLGVLAAVSIRIFLNQNVTVYSYYGLERINHYVGNGKIFSYPFLPGLYFHLKKPSPYRYNFLFTGLFSPSEFAITENELTEQRPDYIVTNYARVEKYGHSIDNPVDKYIRAFYRPIDSFRSVQIWERLPEIETEPR